MDHDERQLDLLAESAPSIAVGASLRWARWEAPGSLGFAEASIPFDALTAAAATVVLVCIDRIDELLPLRLASYVDEDMDIVRLNYPVQSYPEKVKSLSFDKLETISGKLLGIKGQYLLLDDNRVLNVRKHNGYRLEFNC